MKKIIFSFLTLSLISFTSCQQEQTTKQYFEQSPEINIAKKVMDSYLKQDWENYRSYYSDTAKLWHNVWWTSDPSITIDQEIEGTKEFLASFNNYSYEDTIWEMIVNNDGQKWVHFWGKWVGELTQTNEKVETVVHLAFGIVGDKIVYEAGNWDNLPMYLVQQRLETESK